MKFGLIIMHALHFLINCYILVDFLGDDIWRYVGKLTEAQRSMLDDKFKYKVFVFPFLGGSGVVAFLNTTPLRLLIC